MKKLRRVKLFFAWNAVDLEKLINEWLAANPNLIYQIEHRTYVAAPAGSSVGFSLYLEFLTADPAEQTS